VRKVTQVRASSSGPRVAGYRHFTTGGHHQQEQDAYTTLWRSDHSPSGWLITGSPSQVEEGNYDLRWMLILTCSLRSLCGNRITLRVEVGQQHTLGRVGVQLRKAHNCKTPELEKRPKRGQKSPKRRPKKGVFRFFTLFRGQDSYREGRFVSDVLYIVFGIILLMGKQCPLLCIVSSVQEGYRVLLRRAQRAIKQ
jgi:hypothetical protein